MMHVSAISNTPSTAMGKRWRLTTASRGHAHRARLAEFQLDARARRITSPSRSEAEVIGRLFTNVECERGEQIAVAIADDRGMLTREVAHQGHVGVAIVPGGAEDDAVVEADEITANRVEPKEVPPAGLVPRRAPAAGRPTAARDRVPGASPG